MVHNNKTSVFIATILVITAVALFCSEAYKEKYKEKEEVISMEIKGVTFFAKSQDEFYNPRYLISLDKLKVIGLNYITIVDFLYQDTVTSNEIYWDRNRNVNPTLSPACLEYAISQAHARGFKVMLKPHLDIPRDWRGNLKPTDPVKWFENYTSKIIYYAKVAKDNHVEIYNIGSEFRTMTKSKYTPKWLLIIAAVRQIYSGALVYGANAVSIDSDEYTYIGFWNAVDYIGLHPYMPLTDKSDPTIDELIKAWTSNANGLNAVKSFTELQKKYDKPLLFTEIGYQAKEGQNKRPNNASEVLPLDEEEQSSSYDALLHVWSPMANWFKGVMWWNWNIVEPKSTNIGFTPENHPAEKVLKSWYQ